MPSPLPEMMENLRSLALELPPEARIAFVARLERGAARRYRAWADRADSAVVATALRLCAAREESIAELADATFPAPAGTLPALDDATKRAAVGAAPVHEGRPLHESLAIQAAAERSGAATWRELCGDPSLAPHRSVLETCARLEEESADLVERLLATGRVGPTEPSARPRPELRFYFSPASRYSYLALTQVPRLESELDVSFDWIPTVGGRIRELRGADPFAGPPLSGQYEWAYRQTDAEAWAAFYGVPYREPRSVELDSPLLGRASVAAKQLGGVRPYAPELAAAVFAHGTWPVDEAVCTRIAKQVGLDDAAFADLLEAGESSDQLERNSQAAFEAGAFGNPTFFVDGEMFWGQDRLPLVRSAVLGCLAGNP